MIYWITLLLGLGAVVIGLLFLLFFIIRRRCNFQRSLNFVFLQVRIPRRDSKEEWEKDRDQISEMRKVVSIGEHFFQSLYGIFSRFFRARIVGQNFLSLEYIASKKEIKFFIGVPDNIKKVVEKQITSFYPEAVVEAVEAPQLFALSTFQSTAYLSGNKDFYYPIKTYLKFESTDPINNILNVLSNVSEEGGDSASIQIMIRPRRNNWQKKSRNIAKRIASGKHSIVWYNPISILSNLLDLILHGKEDDSATKNETKEDAESQEMIKAIEEKAEKAAFETIIRLVVSSNSKRQADLHLSSLLNSFAQFSAPNLNGFFRHRWHSGRGLLKKFIMRSFSRSWHKQKKLVLNCEELNSLFHFPHIKYNNLPAISWQNYKIVQCPANLPEKGLFLGNNLYRGIARPIYIKNEDRFRHFYVIGQTGTGKSSIFQEMAAQDILENRGLCIVDPHGSLVDSLLPFVPKSRIDDVIIFDPSDTERPMGLNLLEAESEEERDLVSLDAMNIMIKMFDEEIFGPRLQDYFRNGVLTLMADPAGGALTDVVRLFTDNAFQQSKVRHVTNPIVKSFWTTQMAMTGEREKAEIIPYFAAKFGAFVTNSMLRNIIGQTKSAFNFAQVMDEKKILFMNLSKGMTGEINSKLLGLIIVSKLQVAALRRQRELGEGHKPTDFYMYIDEFQNYVTDSIESILSEARKYRLSLNIAHQYVSQIDTSNAYDKKGVNLKDAVFGNIGTMMCYKIGAPDAEVMSKEMAPNFSDHDLINLDAFKGAIKLSIDGKPTAPFSISVDKPWLKAGGNPKMVSALKQISRLTHGRAKKFVEKEIYARLNI